MSGPGTCKVTLSVTTEGREAVEDALLELGAAIVSKPAGKAHWLLEAIFEDQQDLEHLRSLPAFDRAQIDWDSATVEVIADRNWIVESQQFRQPVRAGIYYVYEAHAKPKGAPGGKTIQVTASVAFGTGQHESTEGCLRALDRLQRKRGFWNILDVGSGSGILAIAAAKTWNAQILATDIDPISIPVAERLAHDNGVSRKIHFRTATGFDCPETRVRAPFDLIMANILAEPLISLAGDMRRHVDAKGVIVLSGLLNAQAQSVSAAYKAQGFVLIDRIVIGEWSTLILGPRRSQRL